MIRRKKDYTFLRMLALITQLGISMLTCIFLCMIIGKFLSERLQISWIFPLFLLLGILAGFRSCYMMIMRFIKQRFFTCISGRRKGESDKGELEKMDK